MAWSFGDGFDAYAVPADAINGYWDSGTTNFSLTPGRFSGSRRLESTTTTNASMLVKSSGQNDAVHHIAVAFASGGSIGSVAISGGFMLSDGATNQCSIGFNKDGSIALYAGALNSGSVLATYANAYTTPNTWYAFEFEVVINNTTGSFKVRKNGNTTEDFTVTGLNTRASANNYANKLTVATGPGASSQQFYIDDLFWKSDATSVAWLGDLKCWTRMPASDQSVTFSRTPTGVLTQQVAPGAGGTTTQGTTNSAMYSVFTAGYDGTVTNVGVALFDVGNATQMKCAIYVNNAGVPGAVLASATATITPVTGTNSFTFSPGVSVVKGTNYWVAAVTNGTSGGWLTQGASGGLSQSVTLAAFPQTNPSCSTNGINQKTWTYTATPANWQGVSEAQQDTTTTYVYSSTPGNADLYGIAAISATPTNIVATTVRGYMLKSDAGTRTAAAQLKSSSVVGTTTWSPSDKTSSITLTGVNLIATSNGSNQGIRAVTGWATGKYYFEVTMGWLVSGDGIGIATSAASLSAGGSGTCEVFQTGPIWLNGAATGFSLATSGAGAIIGIAVDCDNKLIWFRIAPSGSWNAISGTTNNPATGVGGINFSSIGSLTVYPYGSFVSFTYAYTANFGAGAFSGAVPSGFISGWPGFSSTTVASPTVVLTNSGWQWLWRTDTTDPNTGAAWTATAVNNVQIGPKVIA